MYAIKNKQKRALLLLICIVMLLVAVVYIECSLSLADSTEDIVLTKIERVDFKNAQFSSNLAWVPGQPNTIAAIQEGFSTGDLVYAYNLNNGKINKLYDLAQYGIDSGISLDFFWAADGNRIVTAPGGVLDLKKQSGFWLDFYKQGTRLTVLGTSMDGKKLLVNAWFEGFFFINPDTKEYQEFTMKPDVFSPPLDPLAWSSDGNWIAVRTYDPDYPPTPIGGYTPPATISLTPIPYTPNKPIEALYLLIADGTKAQLVARNIKGDIDHVTFSPDGKRLVWVVRDYEGNQSIFIANLDGSDAHEIFSNKGLPTAYKITRNILWSADGNKLVFLGGSKDNVYPFWILTLGTGEAITPMP